MSAIRSRRTLLFEIAAVGMLAACMVAMAGWPTRVSAGTSSPDSSSSILSVESVRISAAGAIVDVRYRVLNPEQAQRALGPKIRPKLIDEKTGVSMSVPTTAKLGALRQTQGAQRTGRTYFVLFVNSARVARGSRVTLELGELRYPGLLVE